MGWVTLQNTPIILSPNQLATDEGWTISGGVAYHDGCFPGKIILRNQAVEAGKTYVINYTVKYYTSGVVYPVIGGVAGTAVSSLGDKTDTIVVPEDATDLTVYFYSTGTLGISYFNYYPVLADPNNGRMLGFNAKNVWTTYYSPQVDMMMKFINDTFWWKNGRLWKQNVNPLRSNFFGVTYSTKITILINLSPTEIKNFFTIRMKTNKPWSVTLEIPPSEGKEDGQLSYIKSGNFKVLNNGDRFADILRNALDPRFSTQIEALFNGSFLQGSYMIATFECTSTEEVKLLSIDVEVSPQQYTY